MSRLRRLRAVVSAPDVTIGHRFRRPPFGGSNQFLLALRAEFRRRGLRVGEDVFTPRTRAALLNSYVFDVGELRRALRPTLRVVHRLDGPLRLCRGYDDGTDELIHDLNRELADATVFQSRYSLEAHRELGLELRDPVVIPNAVDPAIFHPPAEREPLGGRRVRLIATSWSDNQNKGAETYAWLAGHLDPDRYELTFVGRAPVELEGVHRLGPLPSKPLADLLRRHDIYVAPSLHDPASNALLEALACGLPVLYARSGGHGELVGDAGLGFDRREQLPELVPRLVGEYEERCAQISVPSLEQVSDRYLEVLDLR
jgi:glycosyltransferase involved in cell wall biosynthesis